MQTTPATDRRLSCAVFQPGMTRADLAARYGEAALSDGLIDVAEGEQQPGTTVFGETPDRLEVFWNERGGERTLTSVVVRRKDSTWTSPEGIRIGTDLQAIEMLNGGPFRLMGFGWDYQGTTMSWLGGALERRDTDRCRVRLRLAPEAGSQTRAEYRQAIGAREFPSNHAAMQVLNPRVYELWLEIGRFDVPPTAR